ncbi:MAG: hypothetical protein LBQ08_02420 [Holosporaceae bacterium]|jgi:methionyl-tRNA formyltransferase|nr:hypothetical protein [Holosporaceae bacterium]
MKIVFVGTVEFSARMLSKLEDIGANVVGVITKGKLLEEKNGTGRFDQF